MFNNIRHLKYVVSVAHCGSLYQASQNLLVSESAVSAAVKACEEEVGYSIFIRRPAKPLSPTSMGAQFIRAAAAFLEQADQFHERAVGAGTELKGTVHLGCFSAIAAVLLPRVIRLCRERYPNLTLSISEHDLAELTRRLRNGEVDVAITYDLHYDSDVMLEPLFRVRAHIGVSPDHRLAQTSSVSLHALADDPMILIDYPITKQHILRLFREQGVVPNVVYYPKTIETLNAFVLNDFGYSVYFFKQVDCRHTSATICRLVIQEEVPEHSVVVAYPRSASLPAKTRAVIDTCKELYGEGTGLATYASGN